MDGVLTIGGFWGLGLAEANGAILVGEVGASRLAFARVSPAGAADVVPVPYGAPDSEPFPSALAPIDADEVLLGVIDDRQQTYRLSILRVDGTIDASFGENGVVALDAPDFGDSGFWLAAAADHHGGVIVAPSGKNVLVRVTAPR
jgi:hypothetical protein